MSHRAAIARIRLNPHSRAVQRDLRDATQMHRTLMRMVPHGLGDGPRQAAGLLYRLDESDTTSTLLVQATTLDPTRLPGEYGHTDLKDLTPLFNALKKGLAVRFFTHHSSLVKVTSSQSANIPIPAASGGRRSS